MENKGTNVTRRTEPGLKPLSRALTSKASKLSTVPITIRYDATRLLYAVFMHCCVGAKLGSKYHVFAAQTKS